MGHYAAEFQCDKCGKLHCVCPIPADATLNHWVVFNGIVILASDVQAMPNGWMNRMFLKHHVNKEDAEKELYERRVEALEAASARLDNAEKMLFPDRPTTSEKLKVYESLLHKIQLNAAVTMNQQKMQEIISAICMWSYEHRAGNGEKSQDDMETAIIYAFNKLRDL